MFHYFQVLHYLKVERFWSIQKGTIPAGCNSLYGRDCLTLILFKIFTPQLLINNMQYEVVIYCRYLHRTYVHSRYVHY